jgi:hypothetical protein
VEYRIRLATATDPAATRLSLVCSFRAIEESPLDCGNAQSE